MNRYPDRPWTELRKGKELTGIRLADLLRPYGVRPRTIWIGESSAKGYLEEDFTEVFRRYLSKAELQALVAEAQRPPSGEKAV